MRPDPPRTARRPSCRPGRSRSRRRRAGLVPAASAAFSAARFAGLPDREPFFLLCCCLPRPSDPPGIGPMPGTFGTPPLATVFIIFAACSKRLTSWFTSVTVVPEPRAMRSRREPFSSFGLRALDRGHRLDDRLGADDLALVEVLELLLHRARARAACRSSS